MQIMKKIRNVLGGAAIGLAALIASAQSSRAEEFDPAVRARIETTNQETKKENKNSSRITIGVGDSSKHHNQEIFRVYALTEAIGNNLDYTVNPAVATPSFSLGESENKIIFAGTAGDHLSGGAIDIQSKFKRLSLSLDADILRSEMKNGERFGGGIDYSLKDGMAGIGYDTVTVNDITSRSFFSHAKYKVTNKDLVGGAAGITDKEGEKTYQARLAYVHFGKDEKIGARVLAGIDTTPEKGVRLGTIGIIVAQNPTFTNMSGDFYIGRTPVGTTGGDVLSKGLIYNALACEPPRLIERSKEGFVSAFDGKIAETRGLTSGFARIEGGYVFNIADSSKLAPTVFYRHDFQKEGDSSTVGASMFYSLNNKLILEARLDMPLKKEQKPVVYLGMQYRF